MRIERKKGGDSIAAVCCGKEVIRGVNERVLFLMSEWLPLVLNQNFYSGHRGLRTLPLMF